MHPMVVIGVVGVVLFIFIVTMYFRITDTSKVDAFLKERDEFFDRYRR